jgi:hypothetical protein
MGVPHGWGDMEGTIDFLQARADVCFMTGRQVADWFVVQSAPAAAVAIPHLQIRICTALDGARIAHAIAGQGPLLVWAANFLSYLDFDWCSPVWHDWLVEACREHLYVSYDERGCGLSDWDAALSFDA